MTNARYTVRNATRNMDLAERASKASNPVRRGIGLIGRASLEPGDGLIIQPCNSIVMFFMRFPIDVVFVNKDSKACYLLHAIKPWRTSKIVRESKLVVELPAGVLARTGTQVGDVVQIERT